MFAVRSGRLDIPPICMGSHLDTQPTGGKFDGNLGVLAGLEVLRTLHQSDYQTNAPIMLVNWDERGGFALLARHAGVGRLRRRVHA